MRSQLFISVDTKMFLKLRNLNSSTCFKVCSIQGIEVVLTTGRNLFFLWNYRYSNRLCYRV